MANDYRTTNLWERPGKIWQRTDDKLWVKLANSRGFGVSVLGAMDGETGEVWWQTINGPKKKHVIKFLDYVQKKRKKKPCVVVLDNAQTHQGQDFIDALETKNIRLHKLPSCSSILNPIETVSICDVA